MFILCDQRPMTIRRLMTGLIRIGCPGDGRRRESSDRASAGSARR